MNTNGKSLIRRSLSTLACLAALAHAPAALAAVFTGDIDNNCMVNVSDLLLLISEWGESISVADINLDGNVNVTDLLLLLGSWG